MDERVAAFRVGVVVLAAAFITGFLIVLLGEGRSIWENRYTVHMPFPKAPGVQVDTPVRKQGVLIGRVTHVELRERGDVMISAKIDSERILNKNDVPRIGSSSLLGDAVVEFVPSDDPSLSREPVRDQEVIHNGIVASDPIQMLTNLEGDIRNTTQAFQAAANNISALSVRLNNALGTTDQQLPRLMQKTELALDKFYGTMTSVDQFIGDPELREKLKQGLSELPLTLEEMRVTMAKARESMDSLQTVQNKAERNLDNLERFTAPLGDRGEDLIKSVDDILRNLDVMTSEVADLTQRISNSDGSLAKFIRDDELYDKVYETFDNLNEASRRIRPILDDFRVFSHKIATDPRQIGLKGALDRKPLGIGAKSAMPPLRESWWQGSGVE